MVCPLALRVPAVFGFGNQLVQDVLGRRIPAAGRDDVARERQVR